MTVKQLGRSGFQVEENKEYVVDMICGMELYRKEAKFAAEYKGKIYYFCSKNCNRHFTHDPEKYIGE